jgi:hypothetical protein
MSRGRCPTWPSPATSRWRTAASALNRTCSD